MVKNIQIGISIVVTPEVFDVSVFNMPGIFKVPGTLH
jgi:hypothetical protein